MQIGQSTDGISNDRLSDADKHRVGDLENRINRKFTLKFKVHQANIYVNTVVVYCCNNDLILCVFELHLTVVNHFIYRLTCRNRQG